MSDEAKALLERIKDDCYWAEDPDGDEMVMLNQIVEWIADELEQQQRKVEGLKAQEPQWISVEAELPEWGVIVLVFIPEHDGEDAYISMDCMNEDYEYWQLISENYDHAQTVGRVTDNDKMPSGVAPYTHWMPLPEMPKESQHE